MMEGKKVALAPLLLGCPTLVTLGIRAMIDDYPQEAKVLLRDAERVFFPTIRFAEVFEAIGKPTFPSPSTYRFRRSRVLQEILFQYLGFPHPQTRLYFGKQKHVLFKNTRFPLLLMGPQIHPNTTHWVNTREALEVVSRRYNPLLVQRPVVCSERVDVICVHFKCIGAHRAVSPYSSRPSFPAEPLPPNHPYLEPLLEPTGRLIRTMHLDDILVEWGLEGKTWHILGLRRPPVRWSTPDGMKHRYRYLAELIASGQL